MRSDEEEGAEDSGPSEAQLAMQKRKQPLSSVSGMDEAAQELLAANREERAKMEEEIQEMRARNERRKREREEEERHLTKRRQEEDARRKAEEEDRKRQKEEAEQKKREERACKIADSDKLKNPPKPNFVITKREAKEAVAVEEEPHEEKKSREQLEAEKQAILEQRVQPLNIAGFDSSKLGEKAKELHNLIVRLESEKYDLDKRFKSQQYDMMELAERARQMNKVGKKQDDLKRIQLAEDESDKVQERFAGCPARIVMYSEYERQKDPRNYDFRRDLYKGPVYGFPADRIRPEKIVRWNEEGQPIYEELEGAAPAAEEAAE